MALTPNPTLALGSPMSSSVSSSDWGSPTAQQRRNTQWEGWGENSKGNQIIDPLNNSRANASSPDSSEHSSEHKYDDRWDKWEPEDPYSHPKRDESHSPFRNSRPNTPSPDSSESASEHKYNDLWDKWELEDPNSHLNHPERDENQNPFSHSRTSTPSPLSQKNNRHWRHRSMEGSDGDSLSHLTGDEDYNPLQNSRPGPSNNRSISRENSSQLQNENTQKIGMSLYNTFFCSQFLLISIQSSTPSYKSKELGVCIF